ncbi:MAG: hypothetical protein JWL90_4008, partial [Chthoniobacteraceae bacterium]|nr:hypothetical protein [Chthoniobacteraceae bacterium]
STGTIFYTVDGPDPRDQFGGAAQKGLGFSSPISVNRPMVIRARVRDGNEWSSLAVMALTADQDFSKLLFTELMFHPRDADDLAEFIELKNTGTLPLDLSGLHLRIRINLQSFLFPAGTVIPPGGFFVLIRDTAAYRAIHPTAQINGLFIGDLDNSVDDLFIEDLNGAIAAEAHYETAAPWQVVPDNHGYFPNDGVGFSLVRITLDPASNPADYRSWRASAQRYGSPGRDDPAPVLLPVYINELLTRSSAGVPEAIEFFNPNPTAVSIDGWWLSDERNRPFRYAIPAGTSVPALGYLVMETTQFGAGVSFSAEGERCYLFSADSAGALTGFSHGFQFRGAERDASFGRYLASDGSEDFPAQINRTFGLANSGPIVPPVVISEVMYNPIVPGDEYIELRNTTDAPFPMWDPQNPSSTWIIESSLIFSAALPANTTIPAQGHLLIVRKNPALFRAAHAVPANVLIVQIDPMFTGFASTQELTLSKPSGLSGRNPRYVIAEHLNFGKQAPWPAGADGGGHSLERINLRAYANDPRNWRDSILSPGLPNTGNLAPKVSAGGSQIQFTGGAVKLTGLVLDDGWNNSVLSSSWSQIAGPAAVQFSELDLNSVSVRFPVPGRYVVRLAASDGSLSAADTATIDVIERPFNAWRTANFTEAELNDSAISFPNADPDHDGLCNDEEYFFASLPKTPGAPNPFHTTIVGGYWQITWLQRAIAPDLLVTPERADRLEGPWFAGAEFFERTEIPNEAFTEVTLREKSPAAGRFQSFFRLRFQMR